ncbi:phage tail tape measure protein [Micromonospora sp. C41]|uniref:phage tail tape measure protein n=1 Tax=Micromonospora sp. C41 TaxID=2824878 RepID=UPI001B39BFD5|nr:phage tail tape measure protein [Micromonospora sp. C41]MBQ1060059.1 phage tail tape measure protein [Micromonospora sp. C41]
MGLRIIGVKLTAEVGGYMNSLKQAGVATRGLVGEMDKAAKGGHLDRVADSAAVAGVGLLGLAGAAAKFTMDFDKQMSEVSAVSDASAGDLERLRQAALQAGADTAFSATEAAQAEAELAKAGLQTADILGGALNGSLALAAAGSLDLAEAADISAKTMNVFGLEGADVGHIADVLASAANKSATDVHEMGEALKMGGLAANAAGMSLEETVGTLAAFADRALVGSDAGTSLKTAIMMLQAPTDKSTALMQELGIAAYDANGEFIGTTKLAGQLQKALGSLTQEQRNAALAAIFGADGMRAANVLYELGEKGVREYVTAVDDQGAAAEVAAKKMDNLAGDVEKLKGSLETMAIEAGSGSTSGLRLLVQTADELVGALSSIPGPVQQGAVALAGIAGATLLAGAGAAKLRAATAAMGEELAATGPRGERAARGLERASRAATRAGVAFVALEVAGAAVRATQEDLNPQIEAMADGLAEWGKTGKLAGESSRVLGADLKDLGVGMKFLADTDNGRRQTVKFLQTMLESAPLLGDALQGTNTSLARTKERVEAMDAALAQLVQGGQIREATAAFNRLAEQAAKDGVSVDELRALLPQYSGAVESAGKASEKAAGGIGKTGEAAATAAADVKKLNDAFDELFGQYMNADTAAIKATQGLQTLRSELSSGARSLNTNTKAGQDNALAVLEQVERVKELRDARYAETGSLESANSAYDRGLAALRRTLIQMGFNRTAVDELIGKYREIPSDVSTQVSAPGAKQATGDVKALNYNLGLVPSKKLVGIWANTSSASAAIDAVNTKIRQLRDRHLAITASVYWTSRGDLKVPGGTQLKNRWGGLYEHARDGLLREAAIYSPMGPARYAFAEPATGGEAFVPKYGDPARSLGILDQAASWYGATVRPQEPTTYVMPDSTIGAGVRGGGGGTTTVIENHFHGHFSGPVGSRVELENWFVGMNDALKNQGRV